LRKEASGFQKDRHGGDVVIRPEGAGSGIVVGAENPMRFAKAAKILRHGFDVVAVEAIDRECLAGNFQADTRKKLLDEIRRPR
jgi:hypothetical protein